jgi:hypothetical protein
VVRAVTGAVGAAAFAFGLGGTATSAVKPAADLKIAVLDAPDPASVGGKVTYTVTVRNAGPAVAKRIVLTTPSGRRKLGSLRRGAQTVVRVVVTPTETGTTSFRAGVTAATRDPRRANNSASATTRVLGRDTVTGHGARPVYQSGDPQLTATIDLDANSAYDGSGPTGTFVTRYPGGDPDVSGHVVCLAVSGNQAMVGGIIDRSSGPNATLTPPGTAVLFAITDKGDRDTELTFFVLVSQGCGVQDAIPEIPLTEGNFVVHDETAEFKLTLT